MDESCMQEDGSDESEVLKFDPELLRPQLAYLNHWSGSPPWKPPKPHTSSIEQSRSGGFAVSLRPSRQDGSVRVVRK